MGAAPRPRLLTGEGERSRRREAGAGDVGGDSTVTLRIGFGSPSCSPSPASGASDVGSSPSGASASTDDFLRSGISMPSVAAACFSHWSWKFIAHFSQKKLENYKKYKTLM